VARSELQEVKVTRARSLPKAALVTGTGLVSAVLVLAIAELLLRVLGPGPWRRIAPPPNEPVMYEADPELGWRNRPGHYAYPGYSRGAPEIRMTYRADGSRATRLEPDAAGPALLLIGGSYVQGWGISDEETVGWRLQERLPDLDVRNFGVGGFGTFQSLILLERLLTEGAEPAVVVYGLIQIHAERNVGAPHWLRSLSVTSRSGIARVPYATLDAEGRLLREPPSEYPRWPLRGWLASVNWLQNLHADRAGAGRVAQRRRVTGRLILEMNDLCVRYRTQLLVVLLQLEPDAKRDYLALLRGARVATLDCAGPIPLARRVPGDGHPNGRQHAIWASCIAPAVQDLSG
jgi:hypothetical protein